MLTKDIPAVARAMSQLLLYTGDEGTKKKGFKTLVRHSNIPRGRHIFNLILDNKIIYNIFLN